MKSRFSFAFRRQALRVFYYSAPIILTCSVFAATNDLSGLLQKGLFEEEANRNLDAASAAYESLVKQLDKDRQIGATAIFRLGEVYRKQGKTNEAAAQYERIVRDFAEQTTLVTLSRQNLAGLRPVRSQSSGRLMSLEELYSHTELARMRVAAIDALPQTNRTAALAAMYSNDEIIEAFTKQRDAFIKQLEVLRQSNSEDSAVVKTAKEHVQANQDRIDARANQLAAGSRQMLELNEQALKARQASAAATVGAEQQPAATVTTVVDEEETEIRRIQAMIQNSPDLINATSGDPARTPLCRAAEMGQLRVAEYLLSNGADVNFTSQGWTPLGFAAQNGHKKMVELLVARGASVDAKADSKTALHIAVTRNFPSVVESLLAAKADPNSRDSGDNTPLMAAVQQGSMPMTKALLARGADVNLVNKVTPYRVFPNVSTSERSNYGSALHLAAARGNVALTQLLLTNRADVTLRSIFGETALHVAAANGSTNVAALLIAAGSDVNAPGPEVQTGGATPLHLAAGGGHREVVKLLLEKGANPNVTVLAGRPGVTPLMWAANGKDAELIAFLLKYKADPNLEDGNGSFALLNAIGQRNPETVRALLAGGADPNRLNPQQYPPLMLAVTDFANKDVAEALIAAKANVNALDPNGKTPLHWAASGNRTDLVELLVKAGADVNLRDKQGKTPLDYVKGNSQTVGGGVGMLPPPRSVMPAPIPGSVSVGEAKSKPDDMALLLRQHGALDELPDFTRIRITRQGLNQPHEVFGRAAKQTNQFTLLETLMRFYGRQSVFSEARKTFGPPYEILPFPDFGRIIIRRPALKPGGKEQEIKVSLLNGKNLLDCAKDVPVEFGDVIEIPERVHALNASMENPPGQVAGMFAESQQVAARMKQMAAEGLTREHPSMVKAANKKSETDAVACLRKVVQLVVGGNTTGLTVDSWTGGFLTEAIAKSEARAALRSSSDLARVQVKRKDAKSGKAMVLTVDATDANDSLWLQDGDVIEVPDRP